GPPGERAAAGHLRVVGVGVHRERGRGDLRHDHHGTPGAPIGPDPTGGGGWPRRYGRSVTHAAALVELAERTARTAGRILLDGLDQVRVDVRTKSSATDMVSEMDRAAEVAIEELLLGARPDDGMLGEEGTDRAGTSGVRWIV